MNGSDDRAADEALALSQAPTPRSGRHGLIGAGQTGVAETESEHIIIDVALLVADYVEEHLRRGQWRLLCFGYRECMFAVAQRVRSSVVPNIREIAEHIHMIRRLQS